MYWTGDAQSDSMFLLAKAKPLPEGSCMPGSVQAPILLMSILLASSTLADVSLKTGCNCAGGHHPGGGGQHQQRPQGPVRQRGRRKKPAEAVDAQAGRVAQEAGGGQRRRSASLVLYSLDAKIGRISCPIFPGCQASRTLHCITRLVPGAGAGPGGALHPRKHGGLHPSEGLLRVP